MKKPSFGEPLKAQPKEGYDEPRGSQSTALPLGMQVPRRLDTEVPKEGAVWAVAAPPWGGVPRTGTAEGVPD
jgi:hypothetical protein